MADGDHPIDRDELLARTDLVQVLDALTTGRGDGHRRTWNCPATDHPDVHPSVTVHTDRHGVQRWRCWSGGHGGTAIDAVLAAHHVDVGEAIRWLDEHYAHLQPLRRDPPPPTRPIGQPAPEVVEYVERCAKLLWSGSGVTIREWLNARGYPDDVLAANKVGADPGRRYLPRPRGFPGGWPAAVYPALDPDGAVTYFQARYLDPPAGRGKYDNPSGRWARNPRLAWTQPTQPTERCAPWLVVTEGIADAIAAARLGQRAVGVLGTSAFDRDAARQIAGVVGPGTQRIVVCFDGDTAGQGGAQRLTDELASAGLRRVDVLIPPEAMDLTDWLLDDPRAVASGLTSGSAQQRRVRRLPQSGHSLVS